uniref:Uncharacterized protein n=1 Tax=Anguilla anguilla TaxID=7936 RepID=A0A0E9QAV1_ANGAN
MDFYIFKLKELYVSGTLMG